MPATTSETPPTTPTIHAGGCLCGAVRFEVTASPLYADWCHCRECQRSSGSIGIPWGCWPAESFRLTEGKPQCFPSSWRGHRFFCAHCGATLHMTDPTDLSTVGVPLTALDDPAAVAPTCHEWVSERPAWVRMDDGLPQYDKDVPPEAR